MSKLRGLLFGWRTTARPHGSALGWLIPIMLAGWGLVAGVYALLAWLFGWWPW